MTTQNQDTNKTQGAQILSFAAMRSRNQTAAAPEGQKAEEAKTEAKTDAVTGESFEDIVRKNMENRERIRRERLKANESVLKSYKIKN